jgi:hypothetical protein
MDIKKWFEDGTKLAIKENRTRKITELPYNVFIDDKYYRGADLKNNIIEHDVTIEHYSETINTEDETKIENFLNKESIHFEKNREWLQDEEMWVTLYELNTFLEKVRIGGN